MVNSAITYTDATPVPNANITNSFPPYRCGSQFSSKVNLILDH